MAVISSSSSIDKPVLEPCYRPRPILPLSVYCFASATSSTFSLASVSPFLTRSSSTRHPEPSSVRLDPPTTPSRSITIEKRFDNAKYQINGQKTGTAVAGTKKTCLCSPSTHPGAFRCAKHRNATRVGAGQSNSSSKTSSSSIRLNCRRSAMINSLLKIGVEGDMVKRALAALVRPSASNQRRRASFQPKPSRLSVMSKMASSD